MVFVRGKSVDFDLWIEQNKDMCVAGNCKAASEKLCSDFPELILVRGHVECYDSTERSHWWTQDKFENIFDPTANQFKDHGGPWVYHPIDENNFSEPAGKCITCGCLYYFPRLGPTCSQECSEQWS